MAMPKARYVHSVKRSVESVDPMIVSAVVSTEPHSPRSMVNLTDLTLRELIRAAMNVGIQAPANGWNTMGKDALVDAIRERVTRDGYTPSEWTRGSDVPTEWPRVNPATHTANEIQRPIDESDSVDEQVIESAPLLNTPSASNTDAVSAAMRVLMDAMQPAAPTVDESTIRAMVDKAMGETLGDKLAHAVAHLAPQITRVEIAGREPIELPGTQHERFVWVLEALGAGEHVYLQGPPATGKSTIAEHAAQALGIEFTSISVGPSTPESRLWGYMDANGHYVGTAFRDAFENGKIFLLDEIDGGHPGILATMNQALANGGTTFPDGYVKRHEDFRAIAAANTYGTGATAQFVGANILSPATLDRFTNIDIDTDEKLERSLMLAQWDNTERVVEYHELLKSYRRRIADNDLKVFVTTRAAVGGVKLLRAGWPLERVLATRVFARVPASMRAKIEGK